MDKLNLSYLKKNMILMSNSMDDGRSNMDDLT